MSNITLKQLRYMEALVRHGHFGRAAADCAISQPALSVQIRELETEIGARLFERGARRVRPTPLGELFASRAREILRRVDELGELARASSAALSGRLRIGIIPTVAPYLLPAILRVLATRHPDVALQVRETLTARLITELEDGRIDAAIVALPISEPGLTETALFEEHFVLVRPVNDRDAPVPSAETLPQMQLLLLEEGHCFRDQALSFCSVPAPRRHEGLDASALSTLVQMVGAGHGVTLIPEMAVAVETGSAEVSVHRLADPQPSRQIGMIWRRTTPLADQLMRLADAVGVAGRGDAAAG